MQCRSRKHRKALISRLTERSGSGRYRLRGCSFASPRVKRFGREAMDSHPPRPCKPVTELCPFPSRNTHKRKKEQGWQHQLDKPEDGNLPPGLPWAAWLRRQRGCPTSPGPVSGPGGWPGQGEPGGGCRETRAGSPPVGDEGGSRYLSHAAP